jgi:hypothetical protein
VVIFLYDLVDNEHDQLTQCHCCHGWYHSHPRFMQLETQMEGLFHDVCLLAHWSRKRRESTEQKHICFWVVCREWWGS